MEKPEIAGTRRVVIRPSHSISSNDGTAITSVNALSSDEKDKIQKCAEHILSITIHQQPNIAP